MATPLHRIVSTGKAAGENWTPQQQRTPEATKQWEPGGDVPLQEVIGEGKQEALLQLAGGHR